MRIFPSRVLCALLLTTACFSHAPSTRADNASKTDSPNAPKNIEAAQPVFASTDATEEYSRGVRWFHLPSDAPSGNAQDDIVWFAWYPAQGVDGKPAPAVLLLHPLGEADQEPMHKYARDFASHGINAVVMQLPWHGDRLPADDNSYRHFVSPQIDKPIAAFEQSVADARQVVTWMSTRPEVDANRIGAVGISLGAIVTHLLMGQDARVKTGVAALGGGALAQSYNHSPIARSKFLFKLFTGSSDFGKVSEDNLKKLDVVDPITYAKNNLPRRVLMIEAARDIVIPPQSAEALWKALGQPPIQWLDTNHFSPIAFGSSSILNASRRYMESAWNDAPLDQREIPKAHAPTLKFGFVMNLDSLITPAVQYQFFSLGKIQHRSFLGANIGMSGRGPFVALGASVTPFIDIGAARRFAGNRIRPYASLHFVY